MLKSQEFHDLLAFCVEIWKFRAPKDSEAPAAGEHLRPIKRQPKKMSRCLWSRIIGDEPAATVSELSSIVSLTGAYEIGRASCRERVF